MNRAVKGAALIGGREMGRHPLNAGAVDWFRGSLSPGFSLSMPLHSATPVTRSPRTRPREDQDTVHEDSDSERGNDARGIGVASPHLDGPAPGSAGNPKHGGEDSRGNEPDNQVERVFKHSRRKLRHIRRNQERTSCARPQKCEGPRRGLTPGPAAPASFIAQIREVEATAAYDARGEG